MPFVKGQKAWNKGKQLTKAHREALRSGHSKEPLPVFLAHVQNTGEGCWEWDHSRLNNGYGKFGAGKKQYLAHRYAWELFRGPIPEDMQIDHLCRNRGCVNPDHMRVVTLKENVLAGIGITALNAKKTHCPQGHPYDAENTYRGVKGERKCRECNKIYLRQRDARKREERLNDPTSVPNDP